MFFSAHFFYAEKIREYLLSDTGEVWSRKEEEEEEEEEETLFAK